MATEFAWSALAAFVAGAGGCAALIKYFAQKALERIDGLGREISELQRASAVIEAKLDNFDYLGDMILDHEKRLAVLDTKMTINGSKRSPYGDF